MLEPIILVVENFAEIFFSKKCREIFLIPESSILNLQNHNSRLVSICSFVSIAIYVISIVFYGWYPLFLRSLFSSISLFFDLSVSKNIINNNNVSPSLGISTSALVSLVAVITCSCLTTAVALASNLPYAYTMRLAERKHRERFIAFTIYQIAFTIYQADTVFLLIYFSSSYISAYVSTCRLLPGVLIREISVKFYSSVA